MKKANSLILVFALFFNISFIAAGEIDLNYDGEVEVGEEFVLELSISNFSEGIYDVKIDILADGNRIAKILNDGQWKSTYYYVLNAIENNDTQEFSLRIDEYIGEAEIEIRIRDDFGSSELFTGYSIQIVETEEIEEPLENETGQTNEIEEELEEFPEEDEFITEQVEENLSEKFNGKFETIVLNSNTIKESETKTIKTENEKQGISSEQYAYYGLAGFCLVLAFLYVIKNKRRDKNEFG